MESAIDSCKLDIVTSGKGARSGMINGSLSTILKKGYLGIMKIRSALDSYACLQSVTLQQLGEPRTEICSSAYKNGHRRWRNGKACKLDRQPTGIKTE